MKILEVGFGTGLNCLLAADLAVTSQCRVHYTGLENHLISAADFSALDHASWLAHPDCAAPLHTALAAAESRTSGAVSARCGALDVRLLLGDADTTAWHYQRYDVVFHDAFSPATSPSLWRDSFLERLTQCLAPGGGLVTYCAKGRVRRAFEATGCQVERLPGPPGKREMLRISPPVT